MKLITASILATALLAGCGSYSPMSRTTSAPMADTPTRTADGVLVGPNGMTLYTFGRDVWAAASPCAMVRASPTGRR